MVHTMKIAIILFFLTFFTVFAEMELSLQKQWLEFKTNYGKNYTSKEEETKRYKIFKENLDEIETHNSNYQKRKTSYKKALNKFGDMTKQEFAQHVNIDADLDELLERGKLRKKIYNDFRFEIFQPPQNDNTTLPSKIDWRERGVVGRVKNQKQCGSCWAFGAIGAIESQLAIKQGNVTHLSEQNLIDCSDDYGNLGCSGGTSSLAFEYVIDRGIAREKDYPTTGQQGLCQNTTASVTKIKGYYYLPTQSEAWLRYIVGTKGPVVSVIHATAQLQFYAGGVFEDDSCNSYFLNHVILVVGYGTDERGHDYWIVKNSWSHEWGHKGYFHLARNAGNMCGVASHSLIPFL